MKIEPLTPLASGLAITTSKGIRCQLGISTSPAVAASAVWGSIVLGPHLAQSAQIGPRRCGEQQRTLSAARRSRGKPVGDKGKKGSQGASLLYSDATTIRSAKKVPYTVSSTTGQVHGRGRGGGPTFGSFSSPISTENGTSFPTGLSSVCSPVQDCGKLRREHS